MPLPALPQRQRGAPEPGPRQRPVHVVPQPLTVPPVLDARRLPVRQLVLREQLVLDRGGADEPGRERVVQQRRVAAPAVRVAVVGQLRPEEQPTLGQVVGQLRVGVLEEYAADHRHRALEAPVGPDRVHDRQAVRPRRLHVVRAEGGRDVHEAGAVLGGYEGPGHHHVGAGDVDEAERGPVVGPGQLGAGHPGDHMPSLAEHPRQQLLRHHHRFAVARLAGERVGLVGVDGHRGVRHQRPRGRGPYQHVGPGQQGIRPGGQVGQREPDRDRGIGDHLVDIGLAHLMVGERGLAAWAVGADPVVPDQQPLVVDGLQRPPDGLDVVRVHGPVGAVKVHPVAEPAGEFLERADVAEYRFTAALVEGRDAVGLDRLLARQPEFLLDRHLDRQPVAVPARLARNVEALHGLEPGEDVLEDPGLDVVHAWRAVGRRRSLVEGPQRSRGRLLQGALEHLAVLPSPEHLVLHGGQVDRRGQGREAACVVRVRHVGWPPAVRRAACRRPPVRVAGGTKTAGGGSAVPPSLAVSAPGGTRPTPLQFLLPVLLGVSCSSGGSGVIWSAGQAPGLAPSPGRCGPRSAAAVPINALQALHDSRSPGREPNGFTATGTAVPRGQPTCVCGAMPRRFILR